METSGFLKKKGAILRLLFPFFLFLLFLAEQAVEQLVIPDHMHIWRHCNVWVSVCCDMAKSIKKLLFMNHKCTRKAARCEPVLVHRHRAVFCI